MWKDICPIYFPCPVFNYYYAATFFDHSCLSVLALSFKNKDLHRSELRLPLLQDRDTLITYYENVVEVGSLVG